jgi:transposase
MLLQGIQIQGPWWRPTRWAKLAPQLPAWLRDLVGVWQQLAVQADEQERILRTELEAAAPAALPRGVGALTWIILSREILDWSRFKNRRQVASYTGLCPGIKQSGGKSRDGSINHCGNRAIRHALIELVWRLVRWQPDYPPVRALVEGGLSSRQRRKHAVAAARRLAIDLWRLATGQCTPAQLKLDATSALT